MKPSEFFDCDYAHDLLEKECEWMPSEFIVNATAWNTDEDVYYARWEADGDEGEEFLAADPEDIEKSKSLMKDKKISGIVMVWFNERESGGVSPSFKEMDKIDAQQARRCKITVLDRI